MKRVIVLVGLKGAGKSTIGHLLSDELGIHFVRVEPLFLEVRDRLGAAHPDYERQGFEAVLARITEALARHDTVCFESTGASEHLSSVLDRVPARVLPVRVLASPDQCVERIAARDTAIHIPVSDDQVERINAIAARVSLPWAAEIDNTGAFDRRRILETVSHLLGTEKHIGA